MCADVRVSVCMYVHVCLCVCMCVGGCRGGCQHRGGSSHHCSSQREGGETDCRGSAGWGYLVAGWTRSQGAGLPASSSSSIKIIVMMYSTFVDLSMY